MPEPQSYKNHTRLDPPYLFALIGLLLNLVFAITYHVRHYPEHAYLSLWWIIMSLVLIVIGLKTRTYALKAQDRVIRLEERLRLAALLPPTDLARSNALTESQLIALRFASDTELPALTKRTLDESLTQKQIKEAIVTWKPDNFRV
jgi:hypothetical protein